ncbi:hypothetical protein DP939_16045 [Spongiactinospora rosea]|uniref:Uncharacterized protein n=1 Tax=Spongiactinospora rosea TaxID=2248750 RepID=A0A366M1G7_9ACTN|nr:hypothetical protein [Spongiactinospora rosea]RBQ19424.1 hypothetical protein DP939_16045 [Spongiactinospora rosea]
MLLTSPKHDTWAALAALTAGALTWQPIALVAGLLTVWTAMGLLSEWHARRTVLALVRTAPHGLITIRQNTSGGQTVRLVWRAGSGPRRRQSRT